MVLLSAHFEETTITTTKTQNMKTRPSEITMIKGRAANTTMTKMTVMKMIRTKTAKTKCSVAVS